MRSSGLILFVCSGLLLSGGVILGGSTLWSLLRMSYYFWTTDLGIDLGSSVLFMAGALLCLPACWLATIVPYHRKSISLLAALMAVATASMVMLALGVSAMSGLSRVVREPAALNASMLRAMSHVWFDPAVRNSFSAMQLELKCCGVHSYSDWYQYRRSIPPACCGNTCNGKRCEQCTMPLYTTGCLCPALSELRNFSNSLSILASAIVLILAVTLFAGAYTLVVGTLGRADPHCKPQSLSIACVQRAPSCPLYAPACPQQAPAGPQYAPACPQQAPVCPQYTVTRLPCTTPAVLPPLFALASAAQAGLV